MRTISKSTIAIVVTMLLFCSAQAQNIASEFQKYGLVDIATLDSTIVVDLAYSTTNNFVGKDMYGDLSQAYFHPQVAKMVVLAQKRLKEKHPELRMIVLDAARPISIQQTMHDLVDGTPLHIYVANPAKGGGRHNYGVAVDISVVDKDGKALDMGAGFDHFGPESHPGREAEFIAKGTMTKQGAKNRAMLSQIMKSVGFRQNTYEWWHFDILTMDELRANYKLLNF